MAKRLTDVATKQVHVADVVRHGEQITLPDGMGLADAIRTLQQKMVAEEQDVQLVEDIDAFIWDGAYAFIKVLEEKYGFAQGVTQRSFFGDNPPSMVSVEAGPNGETVEVPWGHFKVPGIAGLFETAQASKNGMAIFRIVATTKRKYEAQVKEIARLTRLWVREHSLYKGKAIKVKFHDSDGHLDAMASPAFLDVSNVDESQMIFSRTLDAAIKTNLFTPITHTKECRELRIPLKRGVLLAGDYGVGKTLVAYNTARKAIDNGWTYIYVEDATELAFVLRFAVKYAPAVVFCEDVDRVVTGERSVSLDETLNVLDGVETKDKELLVVFTTNHVEKVHQAALRPGRLDAVIAMTRPDGEAVQRLIRLYGGNLIAQNADLSRVGALLAGNIPAVIRECVERSKLAALRMGESGRITAEALAESAETMTMQLELLNRKPAEQPHPLQLLGAEIGKSVVIGASLANGGASSQLAEAFVAGRKKLVHYQPAKLGE